jgi:hypothetical protein
MKSTPNRFSQLIGIQIAADKSTLMPIKWKSVAHTHDKLALSLRFVMP